MSYTKAIAASILVQLSILTTQSRAEETPKLLETAEMLVKQLPADHNDYSHSDMHIDFKGEHGADQYISHCDCSGLLSILLEHDYGLTPARFKTWIGHTHPLAHHYHDQIEAEKGFKQIKHVDEIRPGDILAIRYSVNAADGGTGHIMIVDQVPQPRAATEPVQPGTKQWEVMVIDSSKSHHGPDDTRKLPDGTYHTGVGRGVFRIYTNDQNEIVGYSWSTTKKSVFMPPDKHHLVAGRLEAEKIP